MTLHTSIQMCLIFNYNALNSKNLIQVMKILHIHSNHCLFDSLTVDSASVVSTNVTNGTNEKTSERTRRNTDLAQSLEVKFDFIENE